MNYSYPLGQTDAALITPINGPEAKTESPHELALDLDLDAAGVLRLGAAIAHDPAQGSVPVARVVGLADVPILESLDCVGSGGVSSVVEEAQYGNLTLFVKGDVLDTVARLEQRQGDIGGWIAVEVHGLGDEGG